MRLHWANLRFAFHHQRVARGRKQVVNLLDHLAVLAVVHAELLKPVVQVGEHLESPRLHALQHVHQPGFDSVGAIVKSRAILEHQQASGGVLLCQLLTAAFIVLQSVMWPSSRHPRPPCLDRSRVDDRRGLAHAVGLVHIDAVRVTVPCQLHRGGRVVPSKVQAVDARPVGRHGKRRDGYGAVFNREDAATAQCRNTFGACLTLMRRVALYDSALLFVAVVVHVVNRHVRDGSVGACLGDEPGDHLRHSQQRGERHVGHAARGIGAGQPFGVNV